MLEGLLSDDVLHSAGVPLRRFRVYAGFNQPVGEKAVLFVDLLRHFPPHIAHRMRTVESADNIVVLSDGIVAENGTHEELMKENGLYRRLVDLQTASANWKLSV